MVEIPFIADCQEVTPKRGSPGAACWDLYAAEEVLLHPYKAARISTGIRYELPPGYVLLLLSRSGFSFKNQIITVNGIGILDEDYRGLCQLSTMWTPDPLSVITLDSEGLKYRREAVFKVNKHERIAQAMLIKYEMQEWLAKETLNATARGEGGFGSTGT